MKIVILDGYALNPGDLSYDCLKARLALPCSREAYYESYRKFFWLLSEKRQ